MIEKLVTGMLGNHEWSLRLAPLSASILSLPLFYWLCREDLTPGGAVMALVVLAMGAKQYDYSADTKQYSTDVLLTVLTLLLGTIAVGDWSRGQTPSKRGTIALGIVGARLGDQEVLFSHQRHSRGRLHIWKRMVRRAGIEPAQSLRTEGF